jgi:hypothetical protein
VQHPDSGAIGLCVQIVEYATDMAEHQRLPSIDVPLLQAAMRRGLTTARSTVILHRMEIEPAKARWRRWGEHAHPQPDQDDPARPRVAG